ncbi:MAG: alpha/beta hydrolase [Isosphaeraceae bacterium]|nr:alpha/beta hydrolase [Isosphaeraceae bacterium]
MKVLYLHGLYSKPGGVKPTFLRSAGFEVINPHLPDDDFDESVRRAQEAFDRERPDVVVGSSRGGAVALHLETGEVPVVLIAPAWKRWGTATRARPQTVILHAEKDEVVPIADSRELLARSGLPASALIVVGLDHNMTDPSALAALRAAVERAASQ